MSNHSSLLKKTVKRNGVVLEGEGSFRIYIHQCKPSDVRIDYIKPITLKKTIHERIKAINIALNIPNGANMTFDELRKEVEKIMLENGNAEKINVKVPAGAEIEKEPTPEGQIGGEI